MRLGSPPIYRLCFSGGQPLNTTVAIVIRLNRRMNLAQSITLQMRASCSLLWSSASATSHEGDQPSNLSYADVLTSRILKSFLHITVIHAH